MATGRVFILESPNPLDLLENRDERLALEQVCKLAGCDAWTFLFSERSRAKADIQLHQLYQGRQGRQDAALYSRQCAWR